jgi:hypothetical protein
MGKQSWNQIHRTDEPVEGQDMVGEGGIKHSERNLMREIDQHAEHVVLSKTFSVASSLL